MNLEVNKLSKVLGIEKVELAEGESGSQVEFSLW